MKEVCRHNFNWWQRLLSMLIGMERVSSTSIEFTWGYFAPRFGLELILHRGTYFKQYYAISFCFIWGLLHIELPFKTKLTGGCDMPQYGAYIRHGALWLHYGGEYDESIGQVPGVSWIIWDLPWFTITQIEHAVLTKDNTWHTITSTMELIDIKDEIVYQETHPYRYTRKSGEVQECLATCYVEQRTYSRKWFPFITWANRYIDIRFSQELGEKTSSWKGGVVGTSSKMLTGESIEQCLRRVEETRKF